MLRTMVTSDASAGFLLRISVLREFAALLDASAAVRMALIVSLMIYAEDFILMFLLP